MTTTEQALTSAMIARRHGIPPSSLARRLEDRGWCERWRIAPNARHYSRQAYDAGMVERIVAAYRSGDRPARSVTVRTAREGWRCLHCGGTYRERRCLSCELTVGRGHDMRRVRLRTVAECDYLVGQHAGSGHPYGPEHDRVDALRQEPIEEQVDVLRRMLLHGLDRDELDLDRTPRHRQRLRLRPTLLRLGWDEELPWEAILLLLGRVCIRCRSAVAGLEYIVRAEGRVGLVELGYSVACSRHCERSGPLPDGWQDRLAELRARKQAAGEMA